MAFLVELAVGRAQRARPRRRHARAAARSRVPRASRRAGLPGARDPTRRALRGRLASGRQCQLRRGAQAARPDRAALRGARGARGHRAVERRAAARARRASSTAACCCSTPPPRCPWWRRTRSLRTGWPIASSRSCAERDGVFPAVLRVDCNGTSAFALRVPTKRPTALVALHDGERAPDLALLQHAANIAALEVERVNAERDHGLRLGSELLAAMLERADRAGLRRPAARGARDRRRRPPCWWRSVPTRTAASDRDLHHELAQRGPAQPRRLGRPSAASRPFPDTDEARAALRSAVGPGVALGSQRSAPQARPRARRGTRGSLGADRRAHAGAAVRALRRGHAAVPAAHPRGGRASRPSACSGRSSPTTRSTPRS